MKFANRATRPLSLTLFAVCSAFSMAHAQTVLNQPSQFPNNNVIASQNDISGGFGNYATAYDDFTLGATTSVTGVTWQGGYFNPSVQSPISQFTLTFYSDSANTPGAPLLTETIPGNANETLVGTDNTGSLDFNYSAALPTTFNAAAGTQYWLSIVPDLGFPPEWGWVTGTGGNSNGYQSFFGSLAPVGADLAFSLSGTPAATTPEPGTVATLLSLGLSSAGFLFQRSRRKS